MLSDILFFALGVFTAGVPLVLAYSAAIIRLENAVSDRDDKHERLLANIDHAGVQLLCSRNMRLLAGIQAVAALIDESAGVAGLHLNGDVATWDELRTGGRFEGWLVAFDEALKLCDMTQDDISRRRVAGQYAAKCGEHAIAGAERRWPTAPCAP